jgi:hypothetical protein
VNKRKAAETSERRKRDRRNTAQWRRTRLAVLDRDAHECQIRLAHCCTHHATTVDSLVGGYYSRSLDDYRSACAQPWVDPRRASSA